MLYTEWEKQRKVSFHASLSHAAHRYVELYSVTEECPLSAEEQGDYQEELVRSFYLYWLRHASSHHHKWTSKDGNRILGRSFYLEMKPLIWHHLEKNIHRT